MSAVADADLSARAAQVLYAYARAVDEGDLDTLRDIALEDCSITRSGVTKDGREEFLAVYRGFRDSDVQGSKHVITNIQAEPEDGGTVRVSAYFEATMFDADGSRRIIGRYSDSLREVEGQLRYAHKRIMVDAVLHLPAADRSWAGVTPKLVQEKEEPSWSR